MTTVHKRKSRESVEQELRRLYPNDAAYETAKEALAFVQASPQRGEILKILAQYNKTAKLLRR